MQCGSWRSSAVCCSAARPHMNRGSAGESAPANARDPVQLAELRRLRSLTVRPLEVYEGQLDALLGELVNSCACTQMCACLQPL